MAPFLHDGLTAKVFIGLGYWEEGSLAPFIPWSALSASLEAPGIPQGSHGRLLTLEKRELLWSCGMGLVKLQLRESPSAASHILWPWVLRLVLISRSVLSCAEAAGI